MSSFPQQEWTGVLISGGLDSAILLGHLLDQGALVQPLYVHSGFVWETAERNAVGRWLAWWESSRLAPLVELEMPIADLYRDHWSLTGEATPDAHTPDDAVYLPGRNALLLIKACLWCQMHDIRSIALALLAHNPFPDATPEFFQAFHRMLGLATGNDVNVWCPFAHKTKDQVLELGRHFPIELTFSCIAPRENLHCGHCNKCAERQAAFQNLGVEDPTQYAAEAVSGEW